MSIIVYANTYERIVQAKTHVVQIKFMDALREVTKNKYFWITSLAGWLGFLEGACFNILNWLYSCQHACTVGQYALITTVYGNASLWGMLLAPLSIKKLGKGKTLVLINSLNIIFIGAIYPVVKYADISIMIWLVLICLWMNALVGAFGHILTPSINGDIRDYQQYVSGERIDGMFAAVDTFELMTYDYVDANGKHATYEDTIAQIEMLKDKGIPASKINIGLPFYSRPTDLSAYWYGYNSCYDKIIEDGWYHCDEINKDFWFNTPEVISQKTQYAIDNGYGGVMIWHYSCDFPSSHKAASLLRAIGETVNINY